MDVSRTLLDYVNMIVDESVAGSVPGLKTLVLDKDTSSIVSMVKGRQDLNSHQVVYFETIENLETIARYDPTKMHHINAVCFLRPTQKNLEHLKVILSECKRYKSYFLYFVSPLPHEFLQQIAEADRFDLVQRVQEMYADFYPVDARLVSLNQSKYWSRLAALTTPVANATATQQPQQQPPSSDVIYSDAVKSVTSLLLSLRRKPSEIRYSVVSSAARKFALDVASTVTSMASMFNAAPQSSSTLLLIVDRAEDVLTPLVQQWTYSAMLHELIGIHNHRLSLSEQPTHILHADDDKEIVLERQHDEFWDANFHSAQKERNSDLRTRVRDLQSKTHQSSAMSTEDMQRIIDTLPEYKKFAQSVRKHLMLSSVLQHIGPFTRKNCAIPISFRFQQHLVEIECSRTALTV